MMSSLENTSNYIETILQTVDRICVKQLVLDNGNEHSNIVNDFYEMCLGFEPYFCLMPTRLDNFISTVHSNPKLRNFICDIVEACVFRLMIDETSFDRLVKCVAKTMACTKNKSQLAPEHFIATISLPSNTFSDLDKLLTQNPVLILFYVVSQHITELSTFNTLYLKNLIKDTK
jgi:hypothetical protein